VKQIEGFVVECRVEAGMRDTEQELFSEWWTK